MCFIVISQNCLATRIAPQSGKLSGGNSRNPDDKVDYNFCRNSSLWWYWERELFKGCSGEAANNIYHTPWPNLASSLVADALQLAEERIYSKRGRGNDYYVRWRATSFSYLNELSPESWVGAEIQERSLSNFPRRRRRRRRTRWKLKQSWGFEKIPPGSFDETEKVWIYATAQNMFKAQANENSASGSHKPINNFLSPGLSTGMGCCVLSERPSLAREAK